MCVCLSTLTSWLFCFVSLSFTHKITRKLQQDFVILSLILFHFSLDAAEIKINEHENIRTIWELPLMVTHELCVAINLIDWIVSLKLDLYSFILSFDSFLLILNDLKCCCGAFWLFEFCIICWSLLEWERNNYL